jgi:hypothetical protein
MTIGHVVDRRVLGGYEVRIATRDAAIPTVRALSGGAS